MTPHPFDLLLFDLDGTLVETAPEITDAVNDTLQQFDLLQVDQGQVERWIGRGTRELLLHAVAQSTGIGAAAVECHPRLEAITAAFDQHYANRCGTRSRLYPQVRETLVALRERGVRLGVVTNKEARYTWRVLHTHSLTRLFDRVICGDTLPTKKPDPAGALACLREFGVPTQRTLFVGDSSIDAATARNAGVAVWLLPYGYNMGATVEACQPDRVIADLSALTKQLGSAPNQPT